ncbi:dephospho-CoA kinase [Leuconostoc miyukkimchii]|uniref:dephospho-CoA kinase n=1 Tax=Leuconostoc miyukkimchii TaxID=910540 RepID=UPI001C7D8D2D|nr:dephospho-CoA kinase [Leuconostoc miyukkimchii]
MLIVGITGGIASGKSTVTKALRDANFPIVDADVVAREVVEPGTRALEKIKLAFGPSIIENGQLNRHKLGNIVFSHPAELNRLNAIMQPAISSAMRDKISFWRTQNVPILIIDIPLLLEKGYENLDDIDKIVVVYADREVQMARLKARENLDDINAKNRIDAQMPIADKLVHADYVLDNNGSQWQLEEQIKNLMVNLKEIAPKYGTK